MQVDPLSAGRRKQQYCPTTNNCPCSIDQSSNQSRMLPDTRRRCPYFVHEDHLPIDARKMLAFGPSRPVQKFQRSSLLKPGVQIKSQQGKFGAPRQCHDHLETMQQIMSRDTSRDCCRVSLSACKRSFRSQMFCYTPSPSRTLSPSSFYLARPGDACPVHPSIHSLREGCTIAPAVLRSPGEHSNISHTALPHPPLQFHKLDSPQSTGIKHFDSPVYEVEQERMPR